MPKGRIERRRVDWDVIVKDAPPKPKARPYIESDSPLFLLLNEALHNPSPQHADRLVKGAVEFARAHIGLARVAVFLLNPKEQVMVGTWGTGLSGQTVDEHHIMFEAGGMDQDVDLAAKRGQRWIVYDDCPRAAHDGGRTIILRHGWVACTTLRTEKGQIGIVFNDAGDSDISLDETKQARLSALAALIAPALYPLVDDHVDDKDRASAHPLVRGVARLLTDSPGLSGSELAERLSVSPSYLARVFKRETKTTLVDYRNELRLTRVLERIDQKADNLLEACLDPGFGSYAQFHRVFRARFGQSPSDYLGH